MASTYCTEAQMELDFATNAVADWSSPDGNAAKAALRITAAIAMAGEEIDGVLRGSKYEYSLPIGEASDGTVPVLIMHIATVLATVWLYDTMGARDKDKSGKPYHQLESRRAWAQETLEKIRVGTIRLEAVS
jgi:hypothetical protein